MASFGAFPFGRTWVIRTGASFPEPALVSRLAATPIGGSRRLRHGCRLRRHHECAVADRRHPERSPKLYREPARVLANRRIFARHCAHANQESHMTHRPPKENKKKAQHSAKEKKLIKQKKKHASDTTPFIKP